MRQRIVICGVLVAATLLAPFAFKAQAPDALDHARIVDAKFDTGGFPMVPKGWRLVSVAMDKDHESDMWFQDASGAVYALRSVIQEDGTLSVYPTVSRIPSK